MDDTANLIEADRIRAHDDKVLREGGTLSNGQEIYTLAERAQIREEIRRQVEAADVALEKRGRRGLHPRVAAIRAAAAATT